jgi:eukaryotic-like serine/threonine-protein kinase
MGHERSDREARVNAAIAAYLSALDSGRPPDREAFLRQHADLAEELGAFLADQDRLQELYLSSPPGLSTAPDATTPGTSVGPEARPCPPDKEADGRAGRYRLEGEIARGGMGVVFRAHDPDLGRSLAVKVLQDRHKGDPAMARRFLEEAQVCGQLQHPGVPPVHELGTLSDGRPFFAMKLVKGHTLAELLRGRNGPADDLPRFLQIFEQVCQTVAFAHSKGILHRDVKPANVMVGAFGEVQVMDWGLAKIIRPAGRERVLAEGPAPTSTVFSTRAGVPDSATQAGTVLGTPAYMAPEQARGQVDYLDERADVFALGATLCELLTGRPPYGAVAKEELLRQAAAGELAGARGRLAGCGVDAELVRLALACLEFEPARRPRDAGAVAGAVAAYRAGVEERARKAELERAAAEARAEEAKGKARAERRARRLTAGLAATVLLALLAGGGGWLWVAARERQALARQADAEQSASLILGKFEQLRDQAGRVRPETVAGAEQAIVLWKQAEGLVGQAEGVLASALGAEAARGRVAGRRQEVAAGLRRAEAAREQAHKEAKLLTDLDNARALRSNWRGSTWDYESADRAYAKAVAAYGLDVFGPESGVVAAAIRKERPTVRLALTVALDHWAICARDKVRARRLWQVAGLTDDDAWRRRFRAAVAAGDLGELKRLAEEARGQPLPALSVELLAISLRDRGARAEAVALLRDARGRHPADFWIHLELGNSLHNPDHPDPTTLDEALGCFWAAVALRPGSAPAHTNLGNTLHAKGRLDEAMAEWRKAIALDPKLAPAHTNLGTALKDKGRLDDAIAEHKKAIDLDPKDAHAHNNLGNALRAKGRVDEATG